MDYRLLRSRRKTLAIEITPRGELLVRAPMGLSKKEIEKFWKWLDGKELFC